MYFSDVYGNAHLYRQIDGHEFLYYSGRDRKTMTESCEGKDMHSTNCLFLHNLQSDRWTCTKLRALIHATVQGQISGC